MRKSTLIVAAWVVLSGGAARAEEGLIDGEGISFGASHVPHPPILMASSLPGMKGQPEVNPVQQRPGMPPQPGVGNALPQPLITDLTNVPNPFDSRKAGLAGQTRISYQLAQAAVVSVTIYDLLGGKVREWNFAAGVAGGQAGLNAVTWDGTDASGRKVSKGGYIAEIVVETPQTVVTAARKIGLIH